MDSRLFLEFLQHSDKKPRAIRPRKDLFDHFDDEKFKKRFCLTKSTVTKLLEQVGIPADCAEPQSFIFLSIFVILHYYYNVSVPASALKTSPTIRDMPRSRPCKPIGYGCCAL